MSYQTTLTPKPRLSPIFVALLAAIPLTSQAERLAFSVTDNTQTVSGCNTDSINLNPRGRLTATDGNATCSNQGKTVDISGCQYTSLELGSSRNPILRAQQNCIKAQTTEVVNRGRSIALELHSNNSASTRQCESQTLELTSDGQLQITGLDCLEQLNPNPNVSDNLILSDNIGNSRECLFQGLTLNANGSLLVNTNDNCLESSQTNPDLPSGFQLLGTASQITHQPVNLTGTDNFDLNTHIILTGVPTAKGGQPGVIQLSNTGQGGVSAHFTEWAYLDGRHLAEQFDYAVLEKGCYLSDNQNSFIVGSFDHTITGNTPIKEGNWKPVFPHHSYDNCSPTQTLTSVFMTVQAYQGAPVVVRAKEISGNNFLAALFEDKAITRENKAQRNDAFSIGYIAFYGNPGGTINVNGTQVPVSINTLKVDHNWTTLDGFTPAQQIRLQEDTNPLGGYALETRHKPETIKVLNLDNKLFAQDISFTGKQPFVFRRK